VAGDEVFDGVDDRVGQATRPVDRVPVDPQFHGRTEGFRARGRRSASETFGAGPKPSAPSVSRKKRYRTIGLF